MRRFGFFALVMLVAIAACARETSSDIRSITVGGKACQNCSTDASITGPTLARFPLDEFRALQRHAEWLSPGATITSIEVRYNDGSIERGIAPLERGGISGEITQLVRWMQIVPFQFVAPATQARRNALGKAYWSHAIRSISLEERGCYGTCPVYIATFRADGTALLRVRTPRCAGNGTATVVFDQATREVQFEQQFLSERYPREAVDTQSAAITVATATQSFASDGPDRTTWDQPFAISEARLDQLVRDTVWKPKVDLNCRG